MLTADDTTVVLPDGDIVAGPRKRGGRSCLERTIHPLAEDKSPAALLVPPLRQLLFELDRVAGGCPRRALDTPETGHGLV